MTKKLRIQDSDFLDKLMKLAENGQTSGLIIAVCGEAATALITSRPLAPMEVFIFSDVSSLDDDACKAGSGLLSELDVQDYVIASPVREAEIENRICKRKDLDQWLQSKLLSLESFAVLIDPGGEHTLYDPCACSAMTLDGIFGMNPSSTSTFAKPPVSVPIMAARYSLTANEDIVQAMEADIAAWAKLSDEKRGQFLLDMLGELDPSAGLTLMHEANVLREVFPLLDDMAGVDEKTVNAHAGKKRFQHKDVFYHTMQVLRNVSDKSQNIWLRMAALLHDIAKPRTKAFTPDSGWTFHGHAEIGSRMVKHLFRELVLGKEHRDYVRKLVALHLRPMALVSEGVTDSAVRRLITDAGEELEDLLTLCRCDITSKNPGKVTRYLSNYDRLVDSILEVVENDRLREWQPPINGQEIMDVCGIPSGVMVGILKTHVENAIIEGNVKNEHDAAHAYLLEIKDELLALGDHRKPLSKKQTLNSLPKYLRK